VQFLKSAGDSGTPPNILEPFDIVKKNIIFDASNYLYSNMLTRLYRKPLLLFSLLLYFFFTATAQQTALYHYQDLSHFAYAKERDSLKKYWACPHLYPDKKVQKKYKELWDSRVEFITDAIDKDNFVHEKEIYTYINAIIAQLISANAKYISAKPFLLLDRSAAVNAYAMGGNMIAVNLGLISFSQSREEIAFVIAHELSHNILNHADRAMKEQAEWVTSEEYQKSLNEVLSDKYERFTRLKKLFEGYTFNRNRHHRYHESDADSLAIVLLKNSHISFDAKLFLRLDSTDREYRQPLQQPVKAYFQNYNLPFEESWTQKRTKGLSSKNYNFRNDTTGIADSLKTHPDCAVRYATTLKLSDANGQVTPIPAAIKEKANRIILWNLFDNGNLTACLYRILLEKDKGNKDEWYDFMAYNVIAGLYLADKNLHRFNAIGIMPKEYISNSYYELQTMLEQLPKESLEQYYKSFQSLGFWQKLPTDALALKSLMGALDSITEDSGKSTSTAAKSFLTVHSTSMYSEFADHFKEK
jgi:hypothetical protein